MSDIEELEELEKHEEEEEAAEPVSAVTVAEDENVTEVILEKTSSKLTVASNGVARSKSPFGMIEEREDPELIKKWKEGYKLRLEEKDAEEEQKMRELKNQAKKELEAFYRRYDAEIDAQKAVNRESQAAFLTAANSSMAPGTEWKRVGEMCDFKMRNSSSSTAAVSVSANSNTDLSRMKSILLKLKQHPKPISY